MLLRLAVQTKVRSRPAALSGILDRAVTGAPTCRDQLETRPCCPTGRRLGYQWCTAPHAEGLRSAVDPTWQYASRRWYDRRLSGQPFGWRRRSLGRLDRPRLSLRLDRPAPTAAAGGRPPPGPSAAHGSWPRPWNSSLSRGGSGHSEAGLLPNEPPQGPHWLVIQSSLS